MGVKLKCFETDLLYYDYIIFIIKRYTKMT